MVEISNILGLDVMVGHWEFTYREDGRAVPEYAIQTSAGVRVADVVWRSRRRWESIRSHGRVPAPIAPEICIEVQSRSNTEMRQLRQLPQEDLAPHLFLHHALVVLVNAPQMETVLAQIDPKARDWFATLHLGPSRFVSMEVVTLPSWR